MFSIAGYVPFRDVSDLCLEAAYTLSSDGRRPRIPVFEGWEGLDEWSRERIVRTIAALFEDMVIQLPKRFALISVGGCVVRPSNRILALHDSSIDTSLEMPVAAFQQFGSRRSSRYTFLDTWTWCVKRKPFDPADVDVDDEGNAYTDPEDDIVSSFVGFSLAVSEVDAPKDAEALLQELLAAAAVVRKSPGFARQRGRPPVQDAVRSYYLSKYPNGHSPPTTWADIKNELATVGIKAGQTTIRNAVNGTQQFDKNTREMPESGI
jgi:hypothetical protein